MTLKLYIALLHGKVETFEKHWATKRKKHPDKYPAMLSEAEWDEQFLTWCELTGEEEEA